MAVQGIEPRARTLGLLGLVVGSMVLLASAAPGAQAQGYAANSCWGRCGYFAADANDIGSCSCASSCEQAGDCCPDKHLYCANVPSAPVCPVLGVGAMSSAGQVTSGVYPNIQGTDLGFTYSHQGTLNIMFGDSWLTSQWGDRNLPCVGFPGPTQDDIHASFINPTRPAWIPLDPRVAQPWSTNSCQKLLNIDRLPGITSGFAPIGVVTTALPLWPSENMGWLKTPVGGFSDGAHATGVFTRAEILGCTTNQQCPTGFVCDNAEAPFAPLIPKYCVDQTITSYGLPNTGIADAAMYLDIGAQKPGERQNYVRGLKFLTAKFKNPAVRTVQSFNTTTSTGDYSPGPNGLFMWGRPDFHSAPTGELPLFLLYQPLPLNWSSDTTSISNWAPKYYKRAANGAPTWVSAQSDATALVMQSASPTYGDINLAMQMSAAYVPELKKWVMLYGGDLPDWQDLGANNDQPRTGAIHMRMADNPWGPWSPPVPVLDRYQAAPFLACDSLEPTGFDWDRAPQDGKSDAFASTGPWQYVFEGLAQQMFAEQCTVGDPMRPSNTILQDPLTTCKKASVGKSLERSNFYGPNIITEWTGTNLPSSVSSYARKATLYWNVSTWNPYQVILISTLIELPDPQLVYSSHKYQLRANGSGTLVRAPATGSAPAVNGHEPTDADSQFTFAKVGAAGNDVLGGALVYVSTPRGYLTRLSNTSIGYSATQVAAAQWEVVATAGQSVALASSIALRQNVSGTLRYLAVSGSALTTQTTNNTASKFRFTWRCEATDSCGFQP